MTSSRERRTDATGKGLYRLQFMELARYLLSHCLAGCLGGVVAATLMVGTNTGSLRDLILHAEGGWLAFALLTFGFAVTFGSAAIAHGVMILGEDGD
jgi:hypothetical protein